ncbi:MAG: hypothetical protein K0Q95_939 [Bacteroidota bacterium]|jgi:hypothetical protein|nr:hypothetical protein [Bacteroidota bacterium]
MDYVERLSREHSRASIDAIAKAVGNDPKEFKKIIDIIFNHPAPLPHRASWLLTVISRSHPELLKPYVRKLINCIPNTSIGGIKRNIIGALCTQKIPSDLQGKIISLCFDLILSPDEPVAVKVLSLEIIFPLTKQYPELKQELKAVIEDQLPKTSAAFHSRGKKILSQLQST